MTHLPVVCHGPRNIPLFFADDGDHDTDPRLGLLSGSRGGGLSL